MPRRPPRQLPMRFDSHIPVVPVPAGITQAVVQALADLLLAAVADTDTDDEPDDAHEDHR
jgi:hypothetical protein